MVVVGGGGVSMFPEHHEFIQAIYPLCSPTQLLSEYDLCRILVLFSEESA